jgi:hypothetical protein
MPLALMPLTVVFAAMALASDPSLAARHAARAPRHAAAPVTAPAPAHPPR